jgi:hypothetical protein
VYWSAVHDDLLWLGASLHYGQSSFRMVTHPVGVLGAAERLAEALLTGAASAPILAAVQSSEEYAEEKGYNGKSEAKKNSPDPVLLPNEYVTRTLPKPPLPLPIAAKKVKPYGDRISPGVHVIFSTDCSDYQNWQSITLFYSAIMCGQTGYISRIASGCSEAEQADLAKTYGKLFAEFYQGSNTDTLGQDGLTIRVHFTPDFKHDEQTNRKYAFYNKPRGLQHWLQNAVPAIPADEVVALLDPDMIFLRPLTATVRDAPNKLYDHKQFFDKKTGKEILEMQPYIVTGKPVAQRYGLGAPWTDDKHKKFNRTLVCGEGSPCLHVSEIDGENHYSVGPPYIATRADFDRIATSWVSFVPKVYSQYPYLLAEMYAYSMAAAHEQLPHLTMFHYMVSNAEGGGEGWDFIDDLQEVCAAPTLIPGKKVGSVKVERFYEGSNMPVLFHYCQHFKITDELSFYKGGHRENIMSCATKPFPMCEPDGVGKNINHKKYKKGTDEYRNERKKKRGGFAVNILHTTINRALNFFHDRMC